MQNAGEWKMGNDNDIERSARLDRRKFLGGLGVGMTAGLSGYTERAEGERSLQQGGNRPILGMTSAPNSLNVLRTSTAYAFQILENVYTFGTTLHPESLEPTGWAFRDWTLNTDNIGSSSPTITAELRDDLTWNDGEDLTAEDVKFTVEYIKEQEPAGTISASQFDSVESVQVDDPNGTTVNYYFSQPDAAWFADVLGNVILPKHVWENVSDYSKYTPRNSDEGLVGAGPMQLRDFNWENWFELEMREDSVIPWNTAEYVDWLDDEGPFIDALRIEVFGSENAMNQALLNGEIDQTYDTVPVDQAAKATEVDSLEVKQSEDDGWAHFSFNLDRVPLDDPAFRQLLVMLLDWDFVIEDLQQGIGARKGDYATPWAYNEWRPQPPTETQEFDGTPLPDLTFPGARGENQLDQEAINQARTFLQEHPRAKHDYTLQDATTDVTTAPDQQEIFVNGQPLTEAHTDNEGNAGQGPLEMSYNPPSTSPIGARIVSNWIASLKTVGIPVRGLVQSFNSQIPKVYQERNFDMFEMGWTGVGISNTHYGQFYGEQGIEPNGFNPMHYTGAQDLIDENKSIMEMDPRKPIVKQILAQIWRDAPTLIVFYSKVLQPVSTRYTGRVQTVGGVTTNPDTWLNVRPADQ